jgi:hypothetical protein
VLGPSTSDGLSQFASPAGRLSCRH